MNITTQSDFVQPAVGQTVTASVSPGSTTGMSAGQVVFIDNGGGYYAISSVPDANDLTLTNLGAPDNATAGTTIPSGTNVTPVIPNYQQGTMYTAMFTNSSTWEAPFRVSSILAYGLGGGGGGGSSGGGTGAQGGSSAPFQNHSVPLTPGTIYTITIGDGGVGGQSGGNGENGHSTQITDSQSNVLLDLPGGTGGAGVPVSGIAASFGSSPAGSTAPLNSGCGGGGGGGSGSGWSVGGKGGSGYVVLQYWL